MIKYGNYVMVADIEELEEEAGSWIKGKVICVPCFGVFHLDNANFPQCFKYVAPWDNHFLGDYIACDKIEMITTIENEIEELKNLKKLIDSI
jgi:hypothetical protein